MYDSYKVYQSIPSILWTFSVKVLTITYPVHASLHTHTHTHTMIINSRLEHVRLRNLVAYLENHPEHSLQVSKYFPINIHNLRKKKCKNSLERNEAQTPVELNSTSTQTSHEHQAVLESMEEPREEIAASFCRANLTANIEYNIRLLDYRIQAEIIKVRVVFCDIYRLRICSYPCQQFMSLSADAGLLSDRRPSPHAWKSYSSDRHSTDGVYCK
jgi:hypothetical protein